MPAPTTITDTVTYADSSPATGKIILSWPPFVISGVAIAGGQKEYPLGLNGTPGWVSIDAYPTVGVQPLGTYYTATYELDRGPIYDEYWLVPQLPATSIGAVRAQFPVTPSAMISLAQLTSGNAASGQFLGWSGSNWTPMFVSSFNAPVRSVMGRTGDVVSQAGDYSAAQVTNAVSTLGSYADPAWITSLSYGKLTGAPLIPAVYWQGGSAGAIYYNGGNVGIGTASPGYALDMRGVFRVCNSDSALIGAALYYTGSFANLASGNWVSPSAAVPFYVSAQNAPLCLQPDNAQNVGIGTRSPLVQLDIPTYNTINSIARFGSLEFQSYRLNNSWIGENLYYNGGWVYRAAGYGCAIQISSGSFSFVVAPSGNALAPASMALIAMTITNAGNVGIGTQGPTSPLQVVNLPTYASDSAAGTGGLTAGAFYKDAGGGLHVKL